MRRVAAASPFKGKPVLKIKGEVLNLPEIEVVEGTNNAQHEEYGVELVRTISIHVPKVLLVEPPEIGRDAIQCKGRSYKINNVDGGDDCSAFWLIEGNAPL